MKHRTFWSLATALALILAFAVPALAQEGEPTAESLIEKNLEAKGGREALEGVQSARITGTMGMGGAMEAPFLYEWKAPNKVRIEFTIQGMTGTQAYDGETGWMVMPFMGKTDPEKMSPEDADQIKDEADFRGPLFDPESKGYTVEYMGEEDVEGTPAYKLKLSKENGDVSTIYLDKEYLLEIKQEDARTIRGQQMESETTIGDYKEVDGILLPYSREIRSSMMPEGQGGQTMVFEKVELNVDIPDERFEMPEPAPAEESEPEEGGR
jgi:outer membrane lipoprotein-sorting protein